jgi:hypothetical protein
MISRDSCVVQRTDVLLQLPQSLAVQRAGDRQEMHLLGLDHYARTLCHVHSDASITFGDTVGVRDGCRAIRDCDNRGSVAAHRFRHQYEKSFTGRHTPVTFTG